MKCRDCTWCNPTSGGWSCDHDVSIARLQKNDPACPRGPHVDHDAAPPEWCPGFEKYEESAL